MMNSSPIIKLTSNISLHKAAQFAGIGYLIIIITGIGANFFVLENLVVQGNADATANNILANETLFRIGIFSFIVMVIADLLVAWALYIFFKPVNNEISLLVAWLRLVNSTIFAIALYNLFSVLQLLSGADYLTAFNSNQLQAQVMIFLDAFNNTWLIGLLFFGMHLYFLSYLIIKSNYIPKILGVFLFIASVGYLADSFASFLLPNYKNYQEIFLLIVLVPGLIGELSFCLWLLIKGNKIPQLSLEN